MKKDGEITIIGEIMGIKVGFYGSRCYDTVQYMAAVLTAAEKKVALLDYSEFGELRNSLNVPAEMLEQDVLDANGADYYKDEKYLKREDYHVILVYYGMNKKPVTEDVSISVLVTGYDKTELCHVEELYKAIKGKCDKEYLMYRDMGSGLKLDTYILETFPGYEKEFRVGSHESGDDIKAMLNCAYENVPVFRNINSGHMEFIENLCRNLIFGDVDEEEIDTKEYGKLFRAVSKGDKYRMVIKTAEEDNKKTKKKGGKKHESWFLGKRKK